MGARQLLDLLLESGPDLSGYRTDDHYWDRDTSMDDDPEYQRAEHYFSIGQNEDDGLGKCWIFDEGRLRVASKGTHGANFGHDYIAQKKLFKGWYDVNNGRVSIVFPDGDHHTLDEVPENLHRALLRKFKSTAFFVF